MRRNSVESRMIFVSLSNEAKLRAEKDEALYSYLCTDKGSKLSVETSEKERGTRFLLFLLAEKRLAFAWVMFF